MILAPDEVPGAHLSRYVAPNLKKNGYLAFGDGFIFTSARSWLRRTPMFSWLRERPGSPGEIGITRGAACACSWHHHESSG